MQRQKSGVGVGAARDAIQAKVAALFGGQGLGFEGLVAVFKLALTLRTASLLCGDLGWRRCRAEEDGAVLDLFRVNAVGRRRRVCSCQEHLSNGQSCRCHCRCDSISRAVWWMTIV